MDESNDDDWNTPEGDPAHLRESLNDYLAEMRRLQQTRFYLANDGRPDHIFRMTEIET